MRLSATVSSERVVVVALNGFITAAPPGHVGVMIKTTPDVEIVPD
jgi:hypothetical protein